MEKTANTHHWFGLVQLHQPDNGSGYQESKRNRTRKVEGASSGDIPHLFNKELIKLIVTAAVVASPILLRNRG